MDYEGLNHELHGLFPRLREALRREYGSLLDEWLERGESKAVVLGENENQYTGMLDDDDIQEYASELFYLDMNGWDGFSPRNLLTLGECKQIREHALAQIKEMVKARAPASGLKSLIREVVSGVWDDRPEAKQDAAFFIYGAILGDGQSERLADLWILENSEDRHSYIFEIESGASLNQSWRACAASLPPEVVRLLDLEWVGIDEENAA